MNQTVFFFKIFIWKSIRAQLSPNLLVLSFVWMAQTHSSCWSCPTTTAPLQSLLLHQQSSLSLSLFQSPLSVSLCVCASHCHPACQPVNVPVSSLCASLSLSGMKWNPDTSSLRPGGIFSASVPFDRLQDGVQSGEVLTKNNESLLLFLETLDGYLCLGHNSSAETRHLTGVVMETIEPGWSLSLVLNAFVSSQSWDFLQPQSIHMV